MSENKNNSCDIESKTLCQTEADEIMDEYFNEKFSFLCNKIMTKENKKYVVRLILAEIVGMGSYEQSQINLNIKQFTDTTNETITGSQEDTGFIANLFKEMILSTGLGKFIRLIKINVRINSESRVCNDENANLRNYYNVEIRFVTISIPSVDKYITKYTTNVNP